MPAHSWANPDQKVFLQSRAVAFTQAQNEKKLPSFWVDVCRDFFLQWPNPASERVPNGLTDWDGSTESSKRKKKRENIPEAATPDEIDQDKWVGTRKDSIKNWYNNNGPNKGKRRTGKTQTVTVTLQSTTPRVLSERNAYSKKYYETRVRPLVDAEIGSRVLDRAERFTIMNKHLKNVYSGEDEDVKEEIRQMIEDERIANEAERGVAESIVKIEELGPEEYLKAQTALPDMIGDFCDAMEQRTGWSFTVLSGGPDPAIGGKIRTISIHKGKDGYGNVFGKAFPNFRETVLAPYSKFLNSVYPESVRKTFALTPKEDGQTSSQASKTNDYVNISSTELAIVHTPNPAPGFVEPPPGFIEPPTDSETANPPVRTCSLTNMQSLTMSNTTPTTTEAITRSLVTAPASPNPPATEGPAVNSVKPPTIPEIVIPPVKTMPSAIVQALTTSSTGPSIVTEPVTFTTALTGTNTSATTGHAISNAALMSADPVESFMGLLNGDLYQNNIEESLWNIPQTNFDTSTNFDASRVNFDFDWSLLEQEMGNESGVTGPLYDMPFLPMNSEIGQEIGAIGTEVTYGPDAAGIHCERGSLQANLTQENGMAGQEMEGRPIAETQSNYEVGRTEESLNIVSHPVYIPNAAKAHDDTESNSTPTLSKTPSTEKQPDVADDINLPPPIGNLITSDKETVSDEKKEEKSISGKRSRKPTTARGEIIPLTEKETGKLPEWLTVANNYLDDLNVEEWKACLESWIKLEKNIGLSEASSHRLNRAQLRPAAFSKWVVSRKYHSIAEIVDMKGFANEWLAWWNDNQPKWRQTTIAGSLPLALSADANDLGCLKRGGPSGIVTMLIALKWWAPIRNEDERWIAAVNDVKACLDGMMAGSKRKGDPSEDGKLTKRKRRG